jgi:lysozyme
MPKQTKKKSTTSRRKPVGRRKKKGTQSLPTWQRNIIVATIVILFIAIFYYFFIRPYTYRWKPCYGVKGYGICMPYGYDVHGLDISHYQGNIDWNTLKYNRATPFPLQFVFMKATEGTDHLDSAFVKNFTYAAQTGFIRGAYHFFSPRTDPAKQADFFIRNVNLKRGDLPPVLDVEHIGSKKKTELQAALKIWLNRVEAHYGAKPIIYASYKFKMKYLNDSIFNVYPYWIAHYYVDSVRYQGHWEFWQHTDAGSVPGINKNVDLNVYNGTLEELKRLCL